MNNDLSAAVERYRSGVINENYDQMSDDAYIIAEAYVRELDPSPITPELLIADGFAMVSRYMYTTMIGEDVITAIQIRGGWFLRNNIHVTTIGQVRTLLRVFS